MMDINAPFQQDRLPASFQFSQSNLQDFVDCERRFDLKYIQQVAWPAIDSEPVQIWETHARAGEQFHRLVHQYYSGVPESALESLVTGIARKEKNSPLAGWWSNFMAYHPLDLPSEIRTEISLSVPFAGRRLVAKFDLLAMTPGERAVIVDWKTSPKFPGRSVLERNIQTLVYPYVLVESGLSLLGEKPLLPHQVEMIYWFSNFPEKPVVIAYGAESHAHAAKHLAGLAQVILSRQAGEFPMTQNINRCACCVYRSLCDRGVQAGTFEELAEFSDLEHLFEGLDLTGVSEISFSPM